LATTFCKIIRDAAQAAGKIDFLLGLTSGGNYPATLHHLPWQQFVAASDALFPQLYWRARDEHNVCKLVRDGTPDTAFDACLPSWRAIAQGKPIIPMGGEISCIPNTAEIAAFGARANTEQLAKMHFYTDDAHLTAEVCAAIKLL
jgi:FAD/FMN-containing dehydrogenase